MSATPDPLVAIVDSENLTNQSVPPANSNVDYPDEHLVRVNSTEYKLNQLTLITPTYELAIEPIYNNVTASSAGNQLNEQVQEQIKEQFRDAPNHQNKIHPKIVIPNLKLTLLEEPIADDLHQKSKTEFNNHRFDLHIDIPSDTNNHLRDFKRPSKDFLSKLLPGPKYIRNIILSELCERFSYYGLSALLVTYLSDHLTLSEPHAVTVTSIFTSLAYFTPLIGGYISDSYLGKFKTIMYLSLVYCIGSLILALTAIHFNTALIGCYFGLLLIAIGTGGIKPCVSSFGADQFTGDYSVGLTHSELDKQTQIYFSAFYFSINLGSVGSFIFVPILREKFGYPVAFAVPAFLLFFATFVLWTARHKYNIIPPQGSVLENIWVAARTAIRIRKERKNRGLPLKQNGETHWIDCAKKQSTDRQMITIPIQSNQIADEAQDSFAFAQSHHIVPVESVENYKALARIMPIMWVLPIFWCLFFQQTSSWTVQAKHMNLMGLEQEQMGVINPIAIMILIPAVEKFVYPGLEKCGIRCSALRKMAVGMFVAALSFAASAWIQLKMDSSKPNSVNVFWQIPQIVLISIAEILISITGLEFAYTEAPATLKSTLSAIYLFTSAIGSLLTSVVYSTFASILSPFQFFLLFAGLMVLNAVIFLHIAKSYKSRISEGESNQFVISPDSHRGSDVGNAIESEQQKSLLSSKIENKNGNIPTTHFSDHLKNENTIREL